MAWQLVPRVEPADTASPEDMEARLDRVGPVESGDAEIDCFRLMINLHVEGRAALATKPPVAEAARLDRPDRVRALLCDPVAVTDAGERYRRSAAVQLAGPAMAPAGVERSAVQPVAYGSAQASAGPFGLFVQLTCHGANPTSPATFAIEGQVRPKRGDGPPSDWVIA